MRRILDYALHTMAEEDGCYDNIYDLKLSWDLPGNATIDSADGIIITMKNTIAVLEYMHNHKCNEKLLSDYMEDNFYSVTDNLRKEFDFFLGVAAMILMDNIEKYSNEEEVNKLIGILSEKFIVILDKANDLLNRNKRAKSETGTINTSVLIIGDVYKNYKELCYVLGEKVLNGTSKKAQLKEWARYFLWEKKGQKFIILDIHDEPLDKEDGRKNKNIYVQYIEVILLKLLSNQKDDNDAFYITTGQFWKLLGMVSDDYKSTSLEELNKRIPEYEITSFDTNKFYQRSHQRLREILYSSLNRLQERALINYEMQTVIVYKNKKNKLVYDVANDIEKKKILKAERQTLMDMGLESKRQAFAKFKDVEFFSILNGYLKKWYDWEYTFNRNKILYNKIDVVNTVDKDVEKLKCDYAEIKLQRLMLNDKVVEALNKNAVTMVENRHKKAEEEYSEALQKYKDEFLVLGDIPQSFLPTKKDLRIFDYSPLFVEIQNRLTDELISIRKNKQERQIIECNNEEKKELDELFGS